MTYAEYLKSNGATEDEVKLLDTTVGRKAFEAMQAAETRAIAADAARVADRETLEKWRDNEIIPLVSRLNNELVVAKGNEGKAREAILALQKEGLINVSKDLGYDPPAAPTGGNGSPNPAAPGFDPNKYFTREDVINIAAQEGDAIALAQDIAYEHRLLFPDKPLNFREMRREALAAKQPVEQFWMNKYGVTAARDKRASEEKAAYEKRLIDQGATAERERLASQYGNPDTRPLTPSNSPFAQRPAAGRDKQPWEVGDRSADRVQHATKTVMDQLAGNRPN